jgi:glutathione peroxidase
MTVFDVPIGGLTGGPAELAQYRGKALLIVNVASKCGLTPQYAGLQKLYETYADRGLMIVGVPCNQFGEQEPGTSDEIAEFCETMYSVTFPLTEKVDVNGEQQHPLYTQLTAVEDSEGKAGDVMWNFEKFLVSPDGAQVRRFRPLVKPEDEVLVTAIEETLPAS